MNQIVEKNKCTGCTACKSICPQNAIFMQENNEGFLQPCIDQEKCIDCEACRRVCPVLNTSKKQSFNKCYVGYNKDSRERFEASSGGIFSLVANYVLDNNGIVIGAAFDENNKLRHIAINKKEELKKLKGSKYLQSRLDDIFDYIKNNLNNKKVLFVGTPCQVAGLKAFIKSEPENLICIDLFCHGIPSQKLFDKYINELEQSNSDKLLDYNFRDNSTGWDRYSNTAIFTQKKVSQLKGENSYMKIFLSDIALRESCYNCNFKLGNKYSDITLGDFWGVKKYYPEFYNKEGVSAIIINTKKGEEIFNSINRYLIYQECKLDEIIAGNPSLKISGKYNENRKNFYNEFDNKTIKELANKYTVHTSSLKKMLRKIKHLIKK